MFGMGTYLLQLYILNGIKRNSGFSAEAGLNASKYLIFSAISSGILWFNVGSIIDVHLQSPDYEGS